MEPAAAARRRSRQRCRTPPGRASRSIASCARRSSGGAGAGAAAPRRSAVAPAGVRADRTAADAAQRERFCRNGRRDETAAYERLVDELLASPHFGERFARHWMDVVRYTDTYGYESDNPAKGAWEYRDYLIRAFNDDVGFDQLVREQLAGDLLPEPRIDRELGINESAIGPMFYHLGEHRQGGSLMFNGVHQQMVDNKIDAFSKAFLALTVACARCHDHKLEAVSQRDYYALAAVFMTPRWTSRVIDAPGKNDAAIARLKELRAPFGASWQRNGSRPRISRRHGRSSRCGRPSRRQSRSRSSMTWPIRSHGF